MKRIAVLALIGALAVCSCPYAGEAEDRIAEIEARITELTEELDALNAELKDLKGDQGFVYEADGIKYEYLRNELYDSNGKTFLIVYFNFENHSEETTTASGASYIKAYQDSVGMDSYFLYVPDNDALSAASTSVKPGGKIEVAFAYKTNSDSDEVTLEFGGLIGDRPEYTIHIDN